VISYYNRWQTACDENVITTDSLLPRPKNASDGLYKPFVISLNVVVLTLSDLPIDFLSDADARRMAWRFHLLHLMTGRLFGN
jgi:hypothetical protein